MDCAVWRLLDGLQRTRGEPRCLDDDSSQRCAGSIGSAGALLSLLCFRWPGILGPDGALYGWSVGSLGIHETVAKVGHRARDDPGRGGATKDGSDLSAPESRFPYNLVGFVVLYGAHPRECSCSRP